MLRPRTGARFSEGRSRIPVRSWPAAGGWSTAGGDSMSEENTPHEGVSRRTVLRLGAAGGVGVALAGASVGCPRTSRSKGLLSLDGAFGATCDRAVRLVVLHRGLPHQPADPDAVPRRSSSVPKALRPEAYGDLHELVASRPDRVWDSRTRSATSSTSCGPGARPWSPTLNSYPDPIVYKIDLPGRAARVHHLAGAADRQERQAGRVLRRHRQAATRPAPGATCR